MSSKNPYIDITRSNQWEWSKRARLLRQLGRLDGADLLFEGQIPVGYFFRPPRNGKGNGEVLAPEKIYIGVCPKCHGTGIFRWTDKDGGEYSGRCADCAGKGFLIGRDIVRDTRYHERRLYQEKLEAELEVAS